MKKKTGYKYYLKKSFIQYAIILFVAMSLLVIGFFVFNFYMNVVKQNETSNKECTTLFVEEYSRYEEGIEKLINDEDIIKTTSDNSSNNRTEASSKLYEFANHKEIKSYFIIVDNKGDSILSNMTKGNQLSFSTSPFLKRVISRIDSNPDQLITTICDVETTNDQRIFYSFAHAIIDDNNKIIGYLFLNMSSQDLENYINTLSEEVLILDRFENAIFSSFVLQKDPGDKLPERRVDLNVDKNGIYDILGTRMYVRMTKTNNNDISIYTLTSIEETIRMLRLASAFFVLMIVAVAILMTLMTRLYTKLNERGIRDFTRDLEVKNLEEQFNPHFVFNVMEAVRFQIDEDPSKAKEMLLAFSTLMRYSINHGHTKVPLETDIDYLNDFLMLQKIRYNNLLTYEFRIPDELLDCLIPKLLLQPIIENSIRHGFIKGQELHIVISAIQEGSSIIYKIEDNGQGITDEILKRIKERFSEEISEETVKHVGLYNVEKVLSMLYGDGYGLNINSVVGKGTVVTVRMPYEVEEDV